MREYKHGAELIAMEQQKEKKLSAYEADALQNEASREKLRAHVIQSEEDFLQEKNKAQP